MDHSTALDVIRQHGPFLADFLGLTDWRINFEVRRIEDRDTFASVTYSVDYRTATVLIDPQKIIDDSHAIDGLFHELAHLLNAPFGIYRNSFRSCVDSEEAESSIWIHASETAILRLEWLWRNHLRKIYLEEFTEPR